MNLLRQPAPERWVDDPEPSPDADLHSALSSPDGELVRVRLEQRLLRLEVDLTTRARAIHLPGEQQDLAAALRVLQAARLVLRRLQLSGQHPGDGPLSDPCFFSTGARP